MTENELKDMEFNVAVNKLSETFDTITSYDELKNFIIKKIKNLGRYEILNKFYEQLA